MKIALLHYTYTPIIGGVEIIMAEQARLFAEHGHEVTVYCGQGASEDPRIRVELLPDTEDAAELLSALEPEFARQDVVFMHNVATMPFHLALTEALWELAHRLAGVRFIAWVHDLAACNPDYKLPSLDSPPWSFIARAHENYRYVAVSDFRRRQFEKLTKTACHVVPNGIDPGRLLGLTAPVAEFARVHRLLERDIVLLHPTRLLRRKNVELGLRVSAALNAAGKNCAYLVTGAPDPHQAASRAYVEELHGLRSELGMEEDALFVQEEFPVGERDLASLFALADALFFPSRQEGFGLPILEAALHRLPAFCAAIEPLDSLLAHGVPPLRAGRRQPALIALYCCAPWQLDAWQARSQARRQYAWPVIYRNYIAPLLTPAELPFYMKVTNALPTLDSGAIDAIAGGYHGDPFAILGQQQAGDQFVVRVFRPDAWAVTVRDTASGDLYPALQLHPDGFFEAILEGAAERIGYILDFTGHDGHGWSEYDPYAFGVLLGPLDLHLFAEGQHWELYDKLGVHLTDVGGIRGVSFHVWAPNAQRVSIVGEFNAWDGRRHPMRKLLGCGVWEIFMPGICEGAHYKFEIKASHGGILLKSDPFAFFGQHGTATASLVFDLKRYTWSDAAWMKARPAKEWHREPLSVYEVHLGSWKRKPEDGNRFLSYRELADTLLPYAVEMGYTHLELLPVVEHPFEGSWGYQVTGYYAPTSRFGNPDDFRYFVDCCHQAGIGIILDWVPGHFPKDAHGLAEFDGTRLYEHADPRLGEHMDWGTLIFNYGRNEVRNFLIANALFWFDQYHIDGLRVDAVASMLYLDYSRKPGEWIPNIHGGRENLEAIYFLKRFNEISYERFPGIVTIAEESTAWPGVSRPTYLGGLGFGFKWNMGWMHDFLTYMAKEPVYRRYHQGDITFSLIYAFHEHFILVLSHDEVVHGKGSMIDKMPGDVWQKFANLRMFYAWMYAHPGKKLLFMGCEFGQWREWNHDSSLDWHLTQWPEHDGLRRLVQHLNWTYKNEPALYDQDDTYGGFEWIDFHDSDNSVIAFLRKSRGGDAIAVVINATPVVREAYRVGVIGDGWWEEIINTDAQTYGGSNVGNFGGQNAEPTAWQGKSHSLLLRLPPLSLIAFKRRARAE